MYPGSSFRLLFFSFLILLTGNVIPALSGTEPVKPIRASRIQSLDFDGKLEEDFYGDLTSLKFIRFQPTYSDTPTENLRVYILYDEHYLYLAGRLFVSDPDLIRSQSFKRDADNASTDYFGLIVDSYNDKENGLAFFTSPSALRYDAAVNNDASGNNPISENWNSYWDVLTHITNAWYDVELRIPWSTLKFNSVQDSVVMGVSIWRYMAAKNETSLFPDISPDLGEMAPWKPSLFHEVCFTGIQAKHPVYLTPYVLIGRQQENRLNEDNTSFINDKQLNYQAGLDIKYNLTSNLTMDFTLNTDFAQVESDDEQINLTRYALFRPEKRQFFQERASLFDFRFNYVNHLFYSRNIGIENGLPVPILGGVRLTGKIGSMDVGFMNMQTATPGSTFFEGLNPANLSSNFSVLRVKQNLFNPYSYVGAMVTQKTDFRGSYNTGYGLDGVFRLRENQYLTLKWAQTFEDSVKAKPLSLEPTRFMVGLEKRGFAGLNYTMSIGNAGEKYHPVMGFTSRINYVFTSADFWYGIVFNEKAWLQNMNIRWGGWVDYNHAIQKYDQSSSQVGVSFQSKNAWAFHATLQINSDFLTENLSFNDKVYIPPGNYWHESVYLTVNTPYNARTSLILQAQAGRFFDGSILGFEFEPRWNPNAHLETSAGYEYKYLVFPSRDQTLISHILRLRVLYMLNPRFSVSAYVQFNNESRLFSGNFKLRYNPSEGNDLYIVFNEILNHGRYLGDLKYPWLNTEVLALKYTYTFKL